MAASAGFSTPAIAQSREDKARVELEQLQKKIGDIGGQIASDMSQKNTLQSELRLAEKALGTLQKSIGENRTALQDTRQRLASLGIRQQKLNKAKIQQSELIAEELRTAYALGRQSQLKVLLNQNNPDTLARALAYYRYFYQARSKHIDEYRAILTELDTLKPQIVSATAELERALQALQLQQQKLLAANTARERAVANLLAGIKNKGSQLKQLEQDRAELADLLEAIEQAVADLVLPDNFKPFTAAKGSMPWPISGRASHRFGKPRNAGKMRWQGVTIPAKAGTEVAAIHHGRVVYSDWLRGSGLLLIIDHGDDYMSLYAHNQSLLREVGEWVTAGTPISTVGSTGGRESNAMYFEIRHKGKPTNPAAWCRR
jgi:septal ring factor EnvC (AmiA/AmiB activator)